MHVSSAPSPVRAGQNVLEAIRQGFIHIWGQRILRVFFLLIVAINFLVMGPVTVGIPQLAQARLAEGAAAFGIIMSAFGAGALLGIVLSGMLPTPRPEHLGPTLLLVISSLSVGVVLMPLFAATVVVA